MPTKYKHVCPYCSQDDINKLFKTKTAIFTHIRFKHPKHYKNWKESKVDIRQHNLEPLKDFGLTNSSIKPRYSLIPKSSLDALAARFELGLEKHKNKSWNGLSNQAGLFNKDWVISRAEHVIHHAMLYIQKLEGIIPDDGDDDAAAIMWGGTCLFEAKRVKDNGKETI